MQIHGLTSKDCTEGNYPVIVEALMKAGQALSQLSERNLYPLSLVLTRYELSELKMLVGSEETPVAAAFLEVGGNLRSYLLVMMPEPTLDDLLAALLGPGRVNRGLEDSAIAEVGNIVGSAFLNHMADAYKTEAAPSVPQVVRDMSGALLETLAAALAAEGCEAVPIVRAEFVGEKGVFGAYLIWLPLTDYVPRGESY